MASGIGTGTGTPGGVDELRAALMALKAPKGDKRAPAPRSSVYGRAAAAVPGDVRQAAVAEVLTARLGTVETSALLPGTALALVVTPVAPLPEDFATTCQLIVDNGATVVALGPEMKREVSDRTRPLSVPLRPDDSLSDEWAMVVCGPYRRLAFLARRRTGTDVWDWLVTQDPVAVHRAGTALLERVPFLRLRVPPLAPI